MGLTVFGGWPFQALHISLLNFAGPTCAHLRSLPSLNPLTFLPYQPPRESLKDLPQIGNICICGQASYFRTSGR